MAEQPGRRVGVAGADVRAGIPSRTVTDAAKPAIAGLDMGGARRDFRSAEIREPHDAGDEPVGVGGDDELGFADRAERLGSVRAVARHALDEHRVHDTVSTAGVRFQLLEHVPVAVPDPQVVVRIADGQVRFQGVLHDGSVATEDDSGRDRHSRPRRGPSAPCDWSPSSLKANAPELDRGTPLPGRGR